MGSGWLTGQLWLAMNRVRGNTYVLEDSLHERDSNLGLLHQVILRVLDLETGMLLSCRVRVFQAVVDINQLALYATNASPTSASQHRARDGWP